jgi:hypothetical protein
MVDWSKYFYYKEGHLYRKIATGPTTKVGDKAGGINGKGYICVRLFNKKFMAHRIIWEMHYGEIPEGFEVDHKDMSKANNSIENLRLATRSQNMLNKKVISTNSSGYRGVSWNKAAEKWQARIFVNKKPVLLGHFNDVVNAAKAYDNALKEYKLEHGRFNLGEHK